MTGPSPRPRDAVNKYFGDDLPETTSDERDGGSADEAADRDRWLRDNVPPHHE